MSEISSTPAERARTRDELRRAGRTPVADGLSVDLQRELARFTTEFIVLLSPHGEVVAASDFNTLGYDPEERVGRHIGEHIHPDDLPTIFELTERARVTPGFYERVRARARHKDGSWRVFDAEVFDASLHSDLQGAVLRIRDVTEEVNRGVDGSAGSSVATVGPAFADRFASLAELIPMGILSADARGFVAYANDAALRILDLPAESVLGQGWRRAVFDEDKLLVAETVAEAGRNPGTRTITFRVTVSGPPRWAKATFAPSVAPAGGVVGWLATIEDVTERQGTERALAYQATHDALTGLPNRALLEDRLQLAGAHMRREGTTVTVLFIDLDGFKAINDRHGHQAGDVVLKEVAKRLRSVIREVDTVARLGGDEFVVVCESLPDFEAERVVARITDSLTQPIEAGDAQLTVGASVGVATAAGPEVDITELLEQADQSMYRVKETRRLDGPAAGGPVGVG